MTPLRFALLLPLLLAPQAKKPADKADAPRAKFVTPLAVAPGFTGKVVVRGFQLDTASEVKAGDKVTAKLVGQPHKAPPPAPTPAAKAGDSEVEVELTIPKDFQGSEIELRVVTPAGTSPPVRLLVDANLTDEKEPNDGFAEAQPVTLPATIRGTIGRPRDVDVFRFTGRKGDRLRLEVTAARLGSPADTLLTLYDANRQIVDQCDDLDGSPDPALRVTLPRDGVYYVGVIESHDAGGPMFPYRLTVAPDTPANPVTSPKPTNP